MTTSEVNRLVFIPMTMLLLLHAAGACRLEGCQEKADRTDAADSSYVKKDSTAAGADSVKLASRITASSSWQVRSLDVFVYEADGLQRLLYHERGTEAECAWEDTGRKIAVVIANAGGTFNTDALQHYDSMTQISASLADDDPDFPLMCGRQEFTPGDDVQVRLTPLLCTVEITEVSASLGTDVLAENPRVWLENVNTVAELFRESGFPLLEPETGSTVMLPSDIGLYTQHPGTRLYCYPNDLPGPPSGNPATAIVLRCEVEGETRTYRKELHPILRASTVHVGFEIK